MLRVTSSSLGQYNFNHGETRVIEHSLSVITEWFSIHTIVRRI